MMLLASVACNKETQTDNQPSVELKPQVTLSFNAALTTPTKTEIGNSETADGVTVHEIYWSKDDKIAVYPHDPDSNAGVNGVEFTSEDLAETSAAEAVFTGEIDPADAYYAFYPTTAGAKWNGGTYSDFSVTLPYEQTANGIASGFAVANVTETEKVTFDHVCGFVKFTIDETYAGKIKEVRFSGKNSEFLAGKLFVYPDEMTRNKINDDKTSVLKLTPSSGETFAAGTYYFTCFPVELTKGLELTFIDSDDKEAVKSSDAAAIIERAGVLNLGTVANLEFESVTPPLADGTYVILAKKDEIYYAMKSTHEANKDRLDEVEFDINADETHIASAVWNLKNVEGAKYEITNSNKYLTAANANNANIGDAKTEMKIVDNGDETFQIIDVETLRNLSRNNNVLGFAFYATTSQNYNLYLKAVTYVEMPELQAPVISVTGNNKTVTVTWTDVEHATSYEVVCGEETQTVDPEVETCTLTMVDYGTYDVTVTAKADGYVSATSEVSEVLLVADDAKVITLDLSQNIFGLSISKSNDASSEIVKTFEGLSYSLMASESCYYYSNKALLLGKKDSYITFPAIESYKLSSIEAYNCTGASSKVTLAVCSLESTDAIEGGTASNITPGDSTTWSDLMTEANTSYRLYITNANAVQLTKIVLTYTK